MTIRALVTLLAGLLPAAAIAQELTHIDVKPASASVGEPVRITVHLDTGSGPVGCGLRLSFGDGATHDLRADLTNMPITLSHVYSRDGEFTVQAQGFLYARGLRTALPCNGDAKIAQVRVADTAAERRRQEQQAAARERSQREADERARQIQAQEREAAAARRQAEQRERDLAQRAEALRRREMELVARDRALRARESAARRAPAASASTGSSEKPEKPAAPAPKPPAPARGTLDAF